MKVIQIPREHFIIQADNDMLDSKELLDYLSRYPVTVVQTPSQWAVTLDEYSHDLIMEIMRGCRNVLSHEKGKFTIVGYASAGVVGV